ncbi:hypothetical protein [Methylobacterium nodulans]|uniref:Cthe-2314-like HEPN domain-containing protein n=1 Tax=Methylobacterium nodulans (strain LMG 21967 / CNCM I-2342 / ORS 2060) TaxID=460265 RepID=B8IGN8_METNO|nr:hypothetical protein [Methylobacterium nodulans]ACL55938.1 hypothetical protein Mnod_0919 [Methylobacterium nodulans ORS 2060]
MTISLYRQYRRALKALPSTGRLMPYGWSPLPRQIDTQWLPYADMLEEFSRGLANVINDLTDKEWRLRAWAMVIAPLSDAQKLATTREFIDAVATVAVGLPYVIRCRFAFAVAHLCHQANQLKTDPWTDDLPLDGELDQSHADRCGKPWRRYRPLKQRLERINAKDFRQGTGDFRNVYTHRLEPHFVVGISQLVSRQVLDDGRVRYIYGSQPPLDLVAVADLLATQRDRCYLAFEAFQALVDEHAEAIRSQSR